MKFQENKLTNVVVFVNKDEVIYLRLKELLSNINKFYSCIIYKVFDDGNLKGWNVQINISQTTKFNTLSVKDELDKMCEAMIKSIVFNDKHVIYHSQPNVELVIKLYKPLIIKLAKEQNQRWQYLEMEDLIQMCNLVICDLYYKGYYIHKRLIRRAFINYVLMHIRKDKDKPIIISLEQEYSKTDDDDKVTVADMIPDTKAINEMNDKDDYEVHCRILEEVKDIVIDFIGPRQYDQLLREYANKSTTNWSRRLMLKIKAHLFEMGITNESYNKYYN